jgi:hypothetical protein
LGYRDVMEVELPSFFQQVGQSRYTFPNVSYHLDQRMSKQGLAPESKIIE